MQSLAETSVEETQERRQAEKSKIVSDFLITVLNIQGSAPVNQMKFPLYLYCISNIQLIYFQTSCNV